MQRLLDRIIERETTPLYTGVSILTTVAVLVLLIPDLVYRAPDWGGLARMFMLVFLPGGGSLINIVLGAIAPSRGEYCGGRIGAVGIAIRFGTTAVFYFARGNHL